MSPLPGLNMKDKDEIYDTLAYEILAGFHQVDQEFSQEYLQTRFKIKKKNGEESGPSTGMVREILERLVLEGLLELKSNGRRGVRKIGRGEMLEAFDLRDMLDEYAIDGFKKVTIRHDDPLWKKLNDLNKKCRDTLKTIDGKTTEEYTDSLKMYGNYNREFHESIIEKSNRRNTLALWRMLSLDIRARVFCVQGNEAILMELCDQHDNMIKYLKNKDLEKLKEISKEHSRYAKNLIESYYKK